MGEVVEDGYRKQIVLDAVKPPVCIKRGAHRRGELVSMHAKRGKGVG